jgi:hypothetical protein
MKKISLLVLAIVLYATTNAQYYAYKTALFVGVKKEFIKLDENEDVNIPIFINGNLVTIDAESPTTYRINEESKQKITEKYYSGIRYRATEMVNKTECLFDIIAHQDGRKVFRITMLIGSEVYQLIFLYDNITP